MFDLRSISLGTGEQHRETLPVTIAPFSLGGTDYHAVPEVVACDFAVTRLRNGWVFDERFEVELHGTCHRCLGDAVVQGEIEAHEFHAFRPGPGAEDEMTSEYLVDDELDTDRMATDAVVLAMPFQVLCRDDCLGLCPRCGTNLNEGPCDCPPVAEPDPRWSALRDALGGSSS
jgi:uncharacterized protein